MMALSDASRHDWLRAVVLNSLIIDLRRTGIETLAGCKIHSDRIHSAKTTTLHYASGVLAELLPVIP